jgi:hypothetical protein
MKPKVLVTLLTGTERQSWPCPELAFMLCSMSADARFDVQLVNIRDARPVEAARNQTIKLARDGGYDWLVSLDNDNFMPVGTPLDVIAAAGEQQSIIGLTYAIKVNEHTFSFFPGREYGKEIDGAFQEVPCVNGGMLMVHRRVWEKIPTGPWFRWQHGQVETLDQGPGGCSEDVYFARLARERGFRVWTHRELLAGHYRTVDITSMVVTLEQMGKQR